MRVIGDTKEQLGVMSLNDALALARSKNLDLIEIAANAVPPVCRIVDYGKFLYDESKRSQDSKRPTGKLKEIQISPAIDPHDLATKRDHAVQFLCDDMKVRIKLRFRGRQKAHKEIGFQVMNQLVRDLALYGQADSPPKLLGDRDLNVLVSPLPRNKRAKNPRELRGPESGASEPVASEPVASESSHSEMPADSVAS